MPSSLDPQQQPQDLLVSASLLRKIDKLRERNIGTHVALPQVCAYPTPFLSLACESNKLVVVGDQSSGKSSLLESLTGIPFPRDVELCTRYATQITQRRDDVSRVEVRIIPGPNASEAHKKHVEGYRVEGLTPSAFRDSFPAILKKVNARMGIRTNPDSPPEPENSSDDANSDADTPDEDSGHRSRATAKQKPSRGGSVFSEDVLKIEICGPSVDYLTVIDVPGIFRTPTEGVTTKDDISMIRNMVRWYIQDSRTVILAVLASNIDISNQEILTMAEEYDPEGERTLGILTKPDLVPELSSKMAVCNIVNGKKKQLKLGYYVVRSRGADQGDADFGRREDMFKEAPWNSLPADRVGVRALKARLAELLGHMARREFPKLRKEINVKLQNAERERATLGPSRKDEHEQRRFLSAIAGRFQGLVRQALEAQYAGNSAFDNSIELRLVTQVVNLADDFSEEFAAMSARRKFKTVEDAAVVPTAAFYGLTESVLESENEVLDFADTFDPEDYPELEGLISDEAVEAPEDGIMEWMKELYTRSRGMDISNINGTVWATAWKEQSSKWPSMSKTFMGKVIMAIHRFVLAALDDVCVDDNVRGELWTAILDELLHRYEVGLQAAEFLVAAERDTKPYTLDHRFNEIRQQSRGLRIGNLLKQKIFGSINSPLVSIGDVQSATEKKSNIEDVVEKLHDDLNAYYDIAQKRFVDNVLNQAINYRLLFGPSTPLGVLSQEWVIGLRADQLEAIAGESPSVKEAASAGYIPPHFPQSGSQQQCAVLTTEAPMSALPNGAVTASKTKLPTTKSSDTPSRARSATMTSTSMATTTTSKQIPRKELDPSASLRTATTASDIRTALAALHARESSLTANLDTLVDNHANLGRSLSRLDNLRAGLGAQVIAARGVSNNMLASAADTAARLSGRVRALDLEKQRVEDTLHVVEQVAELKACVAGVVGSMGAPQDWEAAAGYINRAARVPDEIVRGGFAAAVVPTVEVPDPPWVTLEQARESLCSLFLRGFKKAAEDGDAAKVTRFFKLFPLIGRGDVGLDVYGQHVCQGVAGEARASLKEGTAPGGGQGRKDGVFFANALTKLFDHIARIVEAHGGLVERHYGTGKMVRVIERLQMEADVQGGIVLDSWSDERAVDRRLTDVKSYPFSFLVQSFLPQQRGLGGTPRVNSPAGGGGTNDARNSEDEGVNMREVDALLVEIAVMLEKWSVYSRFLAGKCKDPSSSDEAPLIVPELLQKSNLHRKVSGKLVGPYNALTTFYFRRSVEKAFQLDESPPGLSLNMSRSIESNPPFIISAVDVVMYIVNTVIRRSISTSQRSVVDAVLPTIASLLGSDFVGMIQRKMRDDYYPKPVVQGNLPPENIIIAFIVHINSLDMANDYLARIVSNFLRSTDPQQHPNGASHEKSLRDSFPFDNDAGDVATRLNNLNTSFSAKATELLTEGVKVLFNQVIKLRLRPVLSDTFRDADYTLTEDELAELAAQNDRTEDELLDQVPRVFEHGWDALMRPVARLMTARTYTMLLELTSDYLARVLEKRVWSYTGGRTSPYGAIRLERDFGGIIGTISKGNYAVREAFGRTAQVLMVANMDEEEWEEMLGEEGQEGEMEWVLSEDERRRARSIVRG
ncbi:COG4 transport protein-domain-containing protein [Dichotomopilus funicola]|uniref:Conserved oligomeric Golgi complex subunit 4 n=1 Tax=Dichotomopilus funicola TaxID=1934379 RepID=A0AAN6ZRV0_9PEZI|nr:COG4 transport protein-domain-containing protein [Dichotomopilus funicola]